MGKIEPENVSTSFEEAKAAVVALLLQHWRSILNREDINVDENFFAIGGDSLCAIRLAVRLNRDGYDIDVQELFDWPTIEMQAALLQGSTTG